MLLGALAAWHATDFPPLGRLLPIIAGGAMTVFAGVHLIELLRRIAAARLATDVTEVHSGGGAPAASSRDAEGTVRSADGDIVPIGETHFQELPPLGRAMVRYLALWIGGGLATVALLGVYIGGFVYVTTFAMLEGRRRWWTAALNGLLIGLLIASLVQILNIRLPKPIAPFVPF
jgi:hypothetical protein